MPKLSGRAKFLDNSIKKHSGCSERLFYLLRTGCQWRLLPREFPPWPTVYYYFRRWEQESVWLTLLRSLYPLTRLKADRRATPSVAIMDGQLLFNFSRPLELLTPELI